MLPLHRPAGAVMIRGVHREGVPPMMARTMTGTTITVVTAMTMTLTTAMIVKMTTVAIAMTMTQMTATITVMIPMMISAMTTLLRRLTINDVARSGIVAAVT
jgi:hypothetical protein